MKRDHLFDVMTNLILVLYKIGSIFSIATSIQSRYVFFLLEVCPLTH
jgi:hypothetical protein